MNAVFVGHFQESPTVFYVHRHAHALNLAVQDAVKACDLVKETLDIVSEISSLIRSSPKRNTMLEELKNIAAVENDNACDKESARPGRITTFCRTRLVGNSCGSLI